MRGEVTKIVSADHRSPNREKPEMTRCLLPSNLIASLRPLSSDQRPIDGVVLQKLQRSEHGVLLRTLLFANSAIIAHLYPKFTVGGSYAS